MSLPKLKLNTHPVLPTVYDDSLSYYEELNKIKFYINALIDEIGEASGMFEEINKEIEELQEAVAALEEQIEANENYKIGDIARGNIVAPGYVPGGIGSSSTSVACSITLSKKLPEGATLAFNRQQISICGSSAHIVAQYIETEPTHDDDLVVSNVGIDTNDRRRVKVTIKRSDNGTLKGSGNADFVPGTPVNVWFMSLYATVTADED